MVNVFPTERGAGIVFACVDADIENIVFTQTLIGF
jgi:hypothetical protein